MGYIVDVHEFELKLKERDPARVEEVLEELEWLPIQQDGDVLTFTEYSFKWGSEVYLDMVRLSEIADGYIVFRGEDGCFWKLEIGNGELVDSEAELVFRRANSWSLDFVKELMSGCYRDDRIVAMIVGGRGCIIDRKSLRLSVNYSVASFLELLDRYLKTAGTGAEPCSGMAPIEESFKDMNAIREELDDRFVGEVADRLARSGDAKLKEIALTLVV